MPELPEVECVRRALKDKIINLKINDIEIKYDKIVENDNDYFINSLKNQTYKDILRKGKYLIFVLDKGYIISHLRMEGKYFYFNEEDEITKHTHVIIHLSNNHKLCYEDVRKFGRMKYVISNDIFKEEPISLLGYDPIIDNEIEYNILLLHEPDYIDKIINNNYSYDLILAGHSLNGSINIPIIKNLFLEKGSKKYYKSYYKINNTDIYISNGIGVSNINFRLFNHPSLNFYRIILS